MCEPAAPLPDDLALCHEIIRQQADTIQESRRRIEQLEHQVELLLRRQFGPRRESVDPAQLCLFTDDAPDDGSEAKQVAKSFFTIPSSARTSWRGHPPYARLPKPRGWRGTE